VLDGLFRAASAIDAAGAYVFVSDSIAAASVEHALGELGEPPLPVTVHIVDPGYVAGEETSVVRSINGGPALPTDKPPRPFEVGVNGRPTLVANVETLANLPYISINGAESFLANSLDQRSPGTFLATISAGCGASGLYELSLGTRLDDAVRGIVGSGTRIRGYLMGGFFGGLLGPQAGTLRLTYDDLRTVGSGLGCGAIHVLGDEDCPIAAAAEVMRYFEHNNAKQCGACIRGTTSMHETLEALGRGEADEDAIGKLGRWSTSLRARGACATLDGAAGLAASLLREFPMEVEQHLNGRCERCIRLLSTGSQTWLSLSLEV
jgi:NADH:ubiquinone oxidoreductase subunit F (NADH-binding)